MGKYESTSKQQNTKRVKRTKKMLSVDEINNLQKENEELKSKLKRLQRQYNNVLDLAKKNSDANEYCLQELEKRLEPFQDDYFIGLNEKQIAKLAKKSIKLMADAQSSEPYCLDSEKIPNPERCYKGQRL